MLVCLILEAVDAELAEKKGPAMESRTGRIYSLSLAIYRRQRASLEDQNKSEKPTWARPRVHVDGRLVNSEDSQPLAAVHCVRRSKADVVGVSLL